jgi:hypothetical protein
MRSQILAHPVHEQLHPPAPRAYIDIEMLAIGEQFTQLA